MKQCRATKTLKIKYLSISLFALVISAVVYKLNDNSSIQVRLNTTSATKTTFEENIPTSQLKYNFEINADEACRNILAKKSELANLLNNNKRWVSDYYKYLMSLNFTLQELNILSEKLRDSTLFYFLYKDDFSNNISISDLYKRKKPAPIDRFHLISEAISNGNYSALSELFGDDDGNSLYAGMPIYTLISNTAKSSTFEIYALLEHQNIKPDLLDIINAIRSKKETDIIKYLIIHSDIKSEIFWTDVNGLQSISKLLIAAFDSELLSTWLSKIKFGALEKDLKITLDNFPTPKLRNLEEALSTLNVLIDFNVIIKTKYGYSKIKSWAPGKWIKKNKEYLNYTKRNLNPELIPHFKKITKKIEAVVTTEHKIDELLVSCERSNDLNEEINNFKIMHKIHDNKLDKFKMPSGLRLLTQADVHPSLLKIRTQLVNAVTRKDWNTAQEKLDLLLNTDIEDIALSAVLENALKANAPFQFIVNLINLGTKLPNTAIHTLARLGHIELIRQLMNYGLDINARNSLGMNAVSWVIFADSYNPAENRNNTLIFLLDNNISYKNLNGELDALNFALIKAKRNDVSILYARTLLRFGAPIDSSHRQQISHLKMVSSNLYSKIIYQLPEFDVSLP